MENIFPLKPIGKKGAMSNTNKIITFGVIALIVFGGLFLYGENLKASFGGEKLTAEEAVEKTTTETGEEVEVQAGVSCPSDSTSSGRGRYLDLLSTNKDKVANIVAYAMPVNRPGKSRATLSNTSASGDGYGSAVDLSCDADVPVVYEPVAVTKKFGAVSGLGFTSVVHPQIVAKGDAIDLTFEGKRQDWIRARIIDNQKAASTSSLNNTNASVAGVNDAFGFYSIEGGTNVDAVGAIYVANGGSAIAVATDEFLDLAVKVKTNQTKSVFGEDGLRQILAIDASKSDWDDPVVSGMGATKIEVSSLKVDDASVLSNYEHFYLINQITELEQTLNYYQKTKSGVNPSTDVSLAFFTESRYNSIELTDEIRVSIFDDSSSNSQVAFAKVNKITIDVS